MPPLPSRPCLALPFTIVTGPNRVRLIAGEDFRYTLTAPGLETWLPAILHQLDGRLATPELFAALPTDRREDAANLLARLYGERVLIDGPAPAAHRPASHRLIVEGEGLLCNSLVPAAPSGNSDDRPTVTALCQDRLDYAEALRFNERRLVGGEPWLWATVGPLSRGYVSPVFLPDAGPCLCCLLTHFQRLSPAPELYDDLQEHARTGQAIRPVPFSPHGVAIVQQLLLWKVNLLNAPDAPAALFQLHVLEAATLEVTAHRVFRDPECSACSGKR